MHVSLMKKGSKALALTLFSVCLSLGTGGFASAHSSFSAASLDGETGVYAKPDPSKVTTYGTGGFILYGHHLSPATTYTLASVDLGTGVCPVSPALGTVTTDLEGNFVIPFTVGTAPITSTTTATATITAEGASSNISIPNPLGGGDITITGLTAATTSISIANPFTGTGTVNATVSFNGTTATITIPNPAGGVATITIPNAFTTGTPTVTITNIIIGVPCIPNTYSISVQQPTTNAVYNAWITITA